MYCLTPGRSPTQPCLSSLKGLLPHNIPSAAQNCQGLPQYPLPPPQIPNEHEDPWGRVPKLDLPGNRHHRHSASYLLKVHFIVTGYTYKFSAAHSTQSRRRLGWLSRWRLHSACIALAWPNLRELEACILQLGLHRLLGSSI